MSALYKDQPKTIQTFQRPTLSQTRYNSNKKIINSLKEEMCNIRESMSKMIKSKQGKGLKIVSGRAAKFHEANQPTLKDNKEDNDRNCKNLQNKPTKQNKVIQKLQQENQYLKYQLKQYQIGRLLEAQNQKKKQFELEHHNQALLQHIKSLDKQLQIFEQQRSHKRGLSQQIKQAGSKILVEQSLNPELKKVSGAPEQPSIDTLKKNNRHMTAQISKLHQKIKVLQLLSNKQIKLIQNLNEKIMQDRLHQISNRHGQHN